MKTTKPKPFRPSPEQLELMRQRMIHELWKGEELKKEEIIAVLRVPFKNLDEDQFSICFEDVFKKLQKHKLLEPVERKGQMKLRLIQKMKSGDE